MISAALRRLPAARLRPPRPAARSAPPNAPPTAPRSRPGRARAGLLAALFGATLLALPPHAEAAPGQDALVLRIVLALARFTQWPDAAAPEQTLRLCVAPVRNELPAAFAAADGQRSGAWRVQVLRAAPGEHCHLLFLPEAAEQATALLRASARAPVLTIGESDGFLSRGGMVELLLVHDALRFDVQLGSLRGAGLDLSSQALRLARQVRE